MSANASVPAVSVANGPNGIFSQWMFVTPEMAKKFLEKNTLNRRVKDNALHRLIMQMRLRQYRITHQGLAFDVNGTLADGQHRLRAIIASNTGVWLLVTYNLSVHARAAIDSGALRTVADNYAMVGYGRLSNRTIAAITVALGGRLSWSGHWASANRLGPDQLHDISTEWQVELAEIHPFSNLAACNSVVLGVALRAMLSHGARGIEKVRGFLEAIKTGDKVDPCDVTALRFRDLLLRKEIVVSGTSQRKDAYERSSSAIAAHIGGRVLTAIKRTSVECFPVPVERIPESVRPLLDIGGE